MSDHIADKIARLMRDVTHGRAIAPTLAEAAAHNGRWLVHFPDAHADVAMIFPDGTVRIDTFAWSLAEFAAANPGALWRPINAERAIVAWPEVTS